MMKKLLLTAVLISGSLSFAQTLGIKGGLNVSKISASDTEYKAGIYGGVLLNIPLADEYSIQPEILYNDLGTKAKGDINLKLNLSYISVPVMFQYNATPQFYLEAGPQFSFLVNSRVKIPILVGSANQLFQKFDVGVGLGAGYYFDEKFGITVRYVAGISNILKEIEVGGVSTSGVKSHNNAFQIGIAYKFAK